MVVDPLEHFLVILIAWVAASALGHRRNLEILTWGGALFLVAASPLAAAFILLTCFEALALVVYLRRYPASGNLRRYLPYVLLLNLFFVDFHEAVLTFQISTIAISFSTIRVFMTAKQQLANRYEQDGRDLRWTTAAGFFLPAIMIGPVFSGCDLRKQVGRKPPQISLKTHRLILQGLVLSLLASPYLTQVVEEAFRFSVTDITIRVVLFFVALFFAFWGQSLIAENTAKFFGYELPQNFDAPWKARNLQEFWARWHRSMARFVMQYIYLPLTFLKVPPRLAIVAAFFFMGLWHEVSRGYLIWGIAHGLILSFTPQRVSDNVWKRWLVALSTWIAVFGLSHVANHF